jgi:MFS family permease
VLVGALPTYGAIGVAAPLLLVLLRLFQGIGLGGEWGGAVLLAAEHAPARRRGLWASFPQTGPSVGFLLANGVMLTLSATLTDDQFRSWGWRVPFLLSALLLAAGLALRASITETPQFLENAARSEPVAAPLARIARTCPRPLLLGAGALVTGYATFYAITTWALHHGTHDLGVDRTTMLACVMAAVAVKAVATQPMAILGDRYGRRRVAMIGCAGMAVWSYPMLALLETGDPPRMVLAFTVGLLAFIALLAQMGAYLPELFEVRVRCTGASTAYNLGGVVGGALTPVVATWLTRGPGTPWPVAGYLVLTAVLSLVCLVFLPDTRIRGEALELSASRVHHARHDEPTEQGHGGAGVRRGGGR